MLERRQLDMRSQLRARGTSAEIPGSWRNALLYVRFASTVVCVLLLLGRPAFGQKLDNNTETAEVVRGTVVNRLTHDPVGHALVYSPDNRFATLTDSEGHFEFHVQKPESPGQGNSDVLV